MKVGGKENRLTDRHQLSGRDFGNLLQAYSWKGAVLTDIYSISGNMIPLNHKSNSSGNAIGIDEKLNLQGETVVRI